MKKLYLLLIAVLMLALPACEEPPTDITDLSPDYSGKMTVLYEGESFAQEGIEVQAEFNEDMSQLDIKLKKVKFVPAMPVRIDVTIMDIPCTENADGSFSFAADGLVPWAMGGPYDTYRANELLGTISDGRLSFEMLFFNTKKNEAYPTEYSGTRTVE